MRLTLIEAGIRLDEVIPLLRHRVLRENRAHWTNRLTGTAIDALIWIDVVLRVTVIRMDAVDGAHFDASSVLGADARLSDHVRHSGLTRFR